MAAVSFNINDIKSALVGGGARQTLFSCQITNKLFPDADFKIPFLVKAASLPEVSLGNMQVPYFGRKINLPGDRVFQPWQVTVINDEDFLIRNALERWSNAINSLQSNVRAPGLTKPASYKSTATVTQYDKTGQRILRRYIFDGIYPQDITAIGLDWNATDQIEEFNVTFMYDYYNVDQNTDTAANFSNQ
jgi:hypothetical protein